MSLQHECHRVAVGCAGTQKVIWCRGGCWTFVLVSVCRVLYVCAATYRRERVYIDHVACPERSVGGKLGTAGVCFSTKCEGLMPV